MIFHTYDNLYNAFVQNGYIPEKDLFTFPYEWRDSNVDNAKLLRDQINKIKQQERWPRVDVVAHSMGGILAREYVEADYYQDDVDQLITLGTPHLGAPKDYLAYEAGDLSIGYYNLLTKYLFKQEAEESGYENLFDYIHERPIVSVQELLPVYDYLFDKDKNEMREYPNNYPRNEFLENLNKPEKIEALDWIEFSKIFGKAGTESSTPESFNVINEYLGGYWEHGYPLGFEVFPLGDGGINWSNGDGTVPLLSAKSENIPARYSIEVNSAHRSLPTDAQKDVLELLTGTRPENEVKKSLIKNILVVSVYSPIDIQIVDPFGKRVGKNFETGEDLAEIEGAYYTGHETENEFITIPNPTDGQYKVLSEGTGVGEYRIEAVSINEENSQGEVLEATKIFEGVAQVGQTNQEVLEVVESAVVVEQSDTIAPIVGIISPESKEYFNSEIVDVEFQVQDDVSLPENIMTQAFLDNETFSGREITLPLLPLGNHELKITAKDEAGNFSEASATFTSKASFDSLIKNVDFYFDQGLIAKKAEKQFLKNNLRQIKQLINHKNHVLAQFRFFSKQIRQLEKVFDKIIDKRIDFLIKMIQKKMIKGIDPFAAQRIVEGLGAVR